MKIIGMILTHRFRDKGVPTDGVSAISVVPAFGIFMKRPQT
jgi:hypothetical protein